MLKAKIAALAITGTLMFGVASAMAGEYGSADEATAMLDKAIAHYNEVGADQAFKDFTAKGGEWQDRDLYVFCFEKNGTTLAHGANEKLLGRDLSQLKDADGKAFVGELLSTGYAGGGWVDYRWPNPVSKKVEQKSSVVKQAGEHVCGVGIYK
jgi:cytochrome c